MTYLKFCETCKGEGRRVLPPYDVKRPTIRVREVLRDPCLTCGGTGYRPAFAHEIAAHEQAARFTDYLGVMIYHPT